MKAPKKGATHKGLWAATGDYLWCAFSDSSGKFKDVYDDLDLRHKVRFCISAHSFVIRYALAD